jgi:hypothetical protein
MRKKLFKFLAFLIGLGYLASGVLGFIHDRNLRVHGTLVPVESLTNITSHSSRAGTTYHADLRFHTLESKEMTVNHEVPEELLNRAKAGTRLAIYYDQNVPTDVLLQDESHSWWLAALVGIGIMLASVFFMYPAKTGEA